MNFQKNGKTVFTKTGSMNEALGIDWNDKTWWSTEGKAPAKAGNLGY